MKKILIFGLPRSGTTLIQNRLSNEFQIPNLNEPFTNYANRKQIEDPYIWTKSVSQGIIKILAQNLDYVNIEQILEVGNFDNVIITQRRNFADVLISLYYAEQIAKKYHYHSPPTVESFVFPIQWAQGMLIWYRYYQQAISNMDLAGISYKIFDYDMYAADQFQVLDGIEFYKPNEYLYNLNFVSSNIPYQTMCANYDQVQHDIAQLIS